MKRVCVVITARASYARIKSVLEAVQRHPELQLQLVVAASALLDRYGSTVDHIQRDGFPVAARVFMQLEGENLVTSAKTTGLGIVELATVFDNLKPDVVVTVADRYETMATAVAAAYVQLPLAHVQGGEVTGSLDEKVRHAVTKLADVHFVATNMAAERVIRMGEEPSRVFVTGCPSLDLAAQVLNGQGALDFDPALRYGGVGAPIHLSERNYLVVLQHPVTTEHEVARRHVTETLHAVKAVGLPTLWFWPNADAGSDGTSKGIRAFRESEGAPNVHFYKNMSPEDFLRIVMHSRGIVGNSSVAIRECSFLGVPAVNIGTRQVGRERAGNVIDVDYDREQIVQAVRQHLQHGRPERSALYGTGQAGVRIAELLATVPLRTDKRLTY